MKIKATFTNSRNGQNTGVVLRAPAIHGGIWIMSERARRAAFKRIGADWTDTNAGVTSDRTARAVDADGWHTFTVYASTCGLKPFAHGKWHAWASVNGVMLSDENTKTLREFPNVDNCINWLFLNGHSDTARALNKHKTVQVDA